MGLKYDQAVADMLILCNKKGKWKRASYCAEFAGEDEDPPLEQHAGIELEEIPDIYGYYQLSQVSLAKPKKWGVFVFCSGIYVPRNFWHLIKLQSQTLMDFFGILRDSPTQSSAKPWTGRNMNSSKLLMNEYHKSGVYVYIFIFSLAELRLARSTRTFGVSLCQICTSKV